MRSRWVPGTVAAALLLVTVAVLPAAAETPPPPPGTPVSPPPTGFVQPTPPPTAPPPTSPPDVRRPPPTPPPTTAVGTAGNLRPAPAVRPSPAPSRPAPARPPPGPTGSLRVPPLGPPAVAPAGTVLRPSPAPGRRPAAVRVGPAAGPRTVQVLEVPPLPGSVPAEEVPASPAPDEEDGRATTPPTQRRLAPGADEQVAASTIPGAGAPTAATRSGDRGLLRGELLPLLLLGGAVAAAYVACLQLALRRRERAARAR